jgi:hypothetical protein
MGPISRHYVEYTTKTMIEGGYVLTVQNLDSTIIVKESDYVATSQSKSDETVKKWLCRNSSGYRFDDNCERMRSRPKTFCRRDCGLCRNSSTCRFDENCERG